MYLVTWKQNGIRYDEYFSSLASAQRFATRVNGAVIIK